VRIRPISPSDFSLPPSFDVDRCDQPKAVLPGLAIRGQTEFEERLLDGVVPGPDLQNPTRVVAGRDLARPISLAMRTCFSII
jgi:hypothetical protein